MKYVNTSIKATLTGLLILALGSSVSFARGGGNSGGGTTDPQIFDTSFAVEYSYSCLSGGCHETDQNLVDEYAASKMTHTMVKCNACHGTHTADTVGLEIPVITTSITVVVRNQLGIATVAMLRMCLLLPEVNYIEWKQR